MAKFDAKNMSTGTSSISKVLKPGTHYARIVDIKLDNPSYNKDALTVTLVLEGPEIANFEGAVKDRLNPSEGTYKGQMAYVRNGKYPFSTYEYKGKVIERDDQVYKWINNLVIKMGIDLEEFQANVQADSIEEYIYKASKYLIDEDLYAYFTIAGKEEVNEYGTNYRMYFPKVKKNASGKYISPFYKAEGGLKDEDLKEHMIVFDEKEHIERDIEIEAEERPTLVSSGTGLTYYGGTTTLSSGSEKSPFKL